jgi:hypothetical protein
MPKPKITPFDANNIPATLRKNKRWAVWVPVWNEKRQKWDKIPHRCDIPEYRLSTANPDHWFTYEQALATYTCGNGKFAGLGYCMSQSHGVVALDLDGCITADGSLKDWAQELVNDMNSYTEMSPSGNGLRIMVEGHTDFDWMNHDIGIETYSGHSNRFVTLTGAHRPGTPADLQAPDPERLNALSKKFGKDKTERSQALADSEMPELIDGIDLVKGSIFDLPIPSNVKEFLVTGETTASDRSSAIAWASHALCNAGLTDSEILTYLVESDAVMDIVIPAHRRDEDSAMLYLWKHHVCPARSKYQAAQAEIDLLFEELPPEDKEKLEKVLSVKKESRFQQLAQFQKRRSTGYYIKGFLPDAEIGVWGGPSMSGKSFTLLDALGSVARGVDWNGLKVKQGNVAYVCAEGAAGFRNRTVAYCVKHGIDPAALPFCVLDAAPNLLDDSKVLELIQDIRAYGNLNIVAIDTLAQSMPGGDENGKDMSKALASAKKIHNATGVTVILVHHTGKIVDNGLRGWSGLTGNVDFSYMVLRGEDAGKGKDANYRVLRVTKMKDGEDGAEFPFRLIGQALGEFDEDGDEITSCVVEFENGYFTNMDAQETAEGE